MPTIWEEAAWVIQLSYKAIEKSLTGSALATTEINTVCYFDDRLV